MNNSEEAVFTPVETFAGNLFTTLLLKFNRHINTERVSYLDRYNTYIQRRRESYQRWHDTNNNNQQIHFEYTEPQPISLSIDELYDGFFNDLNRKIGSYIVNTVDSTYELLFSQNYHRRIPNNAPILERQHCINCTEVEKHIIENLPHPDILQHDNHTIYYRRVVIYVVIAYYIYSKVRNYNASLCEKISQILSGIENIPTDGSPREIWSKFLSYTSENIKNELGYDNSKQ